jgi:hypothetical protein
MKFICEIVNSGHEIKICDKLGATVLLNSFILPTFVLLMNYHE